MASAIPRTSSSLTLQPNLFQVFHPIGGARARPLETALSCASAALLSDETRRRTSQNIFLGMWVGLASAAMGALIFIRTMSETEAVGLTIPACASKFVWPNGGIRMRLLGAGRGNA